MSNESFAEQLAAWIQKNKENAIMSNSDLSVTNDSAIERTEALTNGHRTPPLMTRDRWSLLLARLQAGESAVKLAGEYGVTAQQIYTKRAKMKARGLLDKNGLLPPRSPGGRPTKRTRHVGEPLLPDGQWDLLMLRLQKGHNINDLAREFGVTAKQIRKRRNNQSYRGKTPTNGASRRATAKPPRNIAQQEERDIVEMYAAGRRVKTIARQYRISTSRVYQIANAAGHYRVGRKTTPLPLNDQPPPVKTPQHPDPVGQAVALIREAYSLLVRSREVTTQARAVLQPTGINFETLAAAVVPGGRLPGGK